MSSAANVPPEKNDGKVEARSISIADGDLKVIDMAATLKDRSRSRFMVENAVAAAESVLRSAGIDPENIRKAA